MLKVEEAPILRKGALIAAAVIILTFFLRWSFLSPLDPAISTLESGNKTLAEQLKAVRTELASLEKRVSLFGSISAELAEFKNSLSSFKLAYQDLEKVTGLLLQSNASSQLVSMDPYSTTRISGVSSRTIIFSGSCAFQSLVGFLGRVEKLMPACYPLSIDISFDASENKNIFFSIRLKNLYRE